MTLQVWSVAPVSKAGMSFQATQCGVDKKPRETQKCSLRPTEKTLQPTACVEPVVQKLSDS